MSYHNAGAVSVMGRGRYLTDQARRVPARSLNGPPQLVAPVLGAPPRLVAPVLGDHGVADYGYLEVRPEDQMMGVGDVGDYGYIKVTPEDQALGLAGLGGSRRGGNRWGMKYPSRVDGLRGVGLGDDAKKQALRTAKLEAMHSVLSDSLWAKLNADLGALLRPVYGAIDAIPISSAAKTELKTRPLDSFVDLFDPIEDVVSGAIARVNARTTNTRNFLGTMVDMRFDQPGDDILDKSTLNLVHRLRTIQQFMVLIILDPINLGVELAAGTAQSALHINLQSSVLAVSTKKTAVTLAKPWAGHAETVVTSPPSGAEILGKDENGTHYRKPPGAQNGTYFVMRSTVNGYLRGMGLGFPIPPAAAATEVVPPAAAAAAPVGVPWLDATIASIIAAATTGAGGAISVVTYNAITQGGAALTSAGTKFISPTTTPVPGSTTQIPVKIGPVTPVVPAGGSASSAPLQGGGFPIIPVAIGAAVIGFLFLSGRDMQHARRMRASGRLTEEAA